MHKSSSSSSASHVLRTFCQQSKSCNQCLSNVSVKNIPFILSIGRVHYHYAVLTLVILSHLIIPSTAYALPSTTTAHDNQHEPAVDSKQPSPNDRNSSRGHGRDFNLQKLWIKGANDQHLRQAKTARVLGLRVEEVDKGVNYENEGVSLVLSKKDATIRLFGDGFTENTIIRFVTEALEHGMDCDDVSSTKSFHVVKTDKSSYSVLANIELPPLLHGEGSYYMCVREKDVDMPWIHQGREPWLQIKTHEALLPVWVIILFLVLLLLLSGLFSGLNLGLMALDKTEMKIIANTGTPTERRYAKIIQPIRDKGNYLLCSLLLGNVMVNSTLTILLDDISSGLIAIIVSTLSIVVLGEIIPQAICSRHGLAVGAKTVYLTKFFMLLTFPLSFPISVVLDKILGEDIGNVYNRDRLKELIKVTHGLNQLEKEEVNIISGALDLKQKTVKEVMTKLEEVFMLPVETILDFDTVSEIMTQGYSRIPIYEGSRHKIVSLLFTKDLALYDTDDKMPLKRFCQFYSNNKMMFVEDSTTLDVLLNDFKQGDQGHMAFVRQVTSLNDDADPDYEVIGLVTLEDVIEEIIQAEISDETDVYSCKNDRSRSRVGLPSLGYGWPSRDEPVEVSPQLCLAAYQFLSTEIKEFDVEIISKNIFLRLLNQNFFFQIKARRDSERNNTDPNLIIFQKGVPSDNFVLVLEGRVQCEMGKENLMFESGPFSYFGTQALSRNLDGGNSPKLSRRKSVSLNTVSGTINIVESTTFSPDYTVRVVTDVTFLRISRSIYLAALQATALERAYLNDTRAQREVVVNFEEQIDKMRTSCLSFSISGRSSSFSGDADSVSTETDDICTDDVNSFPNGFASRNKLQKLNGSPMYKKKQSVLGEIILTPQALLNGEANKSDHNVKGDGVAENRAMDITNQNGVTSLNNINKAMKHENGQCYENGVCDDEEKQHCKL